MYHERQEGEGPDSSHLLRTLFGSQVVAFHPELARALGGIAEALFLQQVMFHANREPDGAWVKLSLADIWNQACLTRSQQDAARKRLTELGVMDERRIGTPGVMHYRPNWTAIEAVLLAYKQKPPSGKVGFDRDEPARQDATMQDSTMSKTSTVQCGKPAVSNAENPHCNSRREIGETTKEQGHAAHAARGVESPAEHPPTIRETFHDALIAANGHRAETQVLCDAVQAVFGKPIEPGRAAKLASEMGGKTDLLTLILNQAGRDIAGSPGDYLTKAVARVKSERPGNVVGVSDNYWRMSPSERQSWMNRDSNGF